MKRLIWIAMAAAMLTPLAASAQFRDLDAANSGLMRGFGNGEAQSIVAGIAKGDQVQLQFPGLVDQSGFFGRDQAADLLDLLFQRTHPVAYETTNTRKASAEAQYYITALWTVQVGGKAEGRELYITLHNKNDHWSVVSIRAASK